VETDELVANGCPMEDLRNRTNCAAPKNKPPTEAPYVIVSLGSIDVKNRLSTVTSTPLTPGETYEVDWELQPVEYVVPAGHRVGLVLLANMKFYVALDSLAAGVSVRLDDTHVTLPVMIHGR
jgi:X-Pro dipeptidyl-peptidase